MKIDRRLLLLAMAKACITDFELCEKAGIARPTLTQLKSGKRNAKPVTIGKIAAALGVDVTDIIEEVK